MAIGALPPESSDSVCVCACAQRVCVCEKARVLLMPTASLSPPLQPWQHRAPQGRRCGQCRRVLRGGRSIAWRHHVCLSALQEGWGAGGRVRPGVIATPAPLPADMHGCLRSEAKQRSASVISVTFMFLFITWIWGIYSSDLTEVRRARQVNLILLPLCTFILYLMYLPTFMCVCINL